MDVYKCLDEFKEKYIQINKIRKSKKDMKEIISKDYC